MINFYIETCIALSNAKQEFTDIVYIGDNKHHYIEVEEFPAIANFSYDNSFGSPKIATDLVIVFRDHSWLSRAEYDGKEWWTYHVKPSSLLTHKATAVTTPFCWSPSLAECNPHS
jgi:hypothetical protein